MALYVVTDGPHAGCGTFQQLETEVKMAKLELMILAGAESKEFLSELTKQIDRLEALQGKDVNVNVKAPAVQEPDAAEECDEDDDFAAPVKRKPGRPKKTASFDEDDDAEESEETVAAEESDDDDDDEEPAPKKKAKKLTVDDVNDACKARAASVGGKKGREEVLAILKKKFKTESVSELKPEQYAVCIAAMAVDEE